MADDPAHITVADAFRRRERARIERIEAGIDPRAAQEESQKLEEKDLPPLDEEFAQALGAPSAEDLTKRMRENMLADKKKRAQAVEACEIDACCTALQDWLKAECVGVSFLRRNILDRTAVDLDERHPKRERFSFNWDAQT